MDTLAKNHYIGITNTMQGLKNIYLLTTRKLMSPEATRDKVAKIVRVVYINNFLGNFHKSESALP